MVAASRIVTLALLGMVGAGAGTDPVRAADIRIDPARTHIRFSIDAVGWPTTRGEFRRFDGRLAIDTARPAASRVEFTVQSASVDVGSSGLNDYIRSDVFFDAAKFPTLRFVSTGVRRTGQNTAHVDGDMTILGVTRPVAFDVTVENRARASAFRAELVIRRSEYGMNSGIPLIDDAVKVEVATETAPD